MRRTWKNFLSLLLVFAMVLSLGATGFALEEEPEVTAPAEEPAEEPGGTGVELSFEKVDNDIIPERLNPAHDPVEEEEPLYADDEYVRVTIILQGASAIDAGYAPARAGSYRSGLLAEQQAMAEKISAEALDGAELEVVWNLTLAMNGISAYVQYGQIEAIRNVIGVKDVVIELQYFPTEEVENIIATEMTGASAAWNLGYTGAGSKIAIVDTGLDIDHQSFDAGAFEYAIDELNETRDNPVDLMDEADVAAVWDQLNAASFIGSYDGVYRNAKVPFAVNYVDRDLDIIHLNDAQGEHGSHVAGIAAANKYIPSGNGYDRALDTVMTQGEAPDAQLLIMKVFGKGGGAYDSDYMIAIEDAMTLGCDAVNLSLGSSVAGYTTNDEYVNTLNKLVNYGLVWANSAGNNYSWTQFSVGPNFLYADDVNYQTGGSPATYHNTLSVASVDNTTGVLSVPMQLLDGTNITYSETSGYGNESISTIPGTYTYIMLTRAGYEEEDFGALGPDILEGNVGVAWRGSSSFYVKANGAAANGAVATIVANNQPGTINMNLSGYLYSAPAVSIMQNDGYLMLESGEVKEANGVVYVEGTIIIPEGVSNTTASPFQQMSSFSSWGGNGALTMKPEITAPGGNIWGIWGANRGSSSPTSAHDGYEYMSGTSMASPQVAGTTAVLRQYIRESGLAEKFPNLTERAIAQSLLMSTSMPLREAATGNYWSIMKQGSGLVDVNAAITARSLIQIAALPETAPESAWTAIADGKVKVETGEVYNGFYTAFTVTNFSDEDMSLYLNGELFTQFINGSYRTEYTVPVYSRINWTVNGEPYTPAALALDFNGDGVSNGLDAQRLLDWCADDTVEIYNLENADLDEDGNVDTADAKIAFETLNGASVELAGGETALIEAHVYYDMSDYDAFNGNYVEGFLFVQEGDTNDGALGVLHSIPIYGFNGNFSDATMFDRGSRLEYMYEFGDGETIAPYMYYASTTAGGLGEAALEEETFLVQYAGDSDTYYFGGNPLLDDETYHPERNALNSADMLAGVRYTQIRNAGASRFFITDKYDRTVTGTEMQGGRSYAAYYYQNQSTWQQTSTSTPFNYVPRHVNEGDELTAHFQLALEYYVNSDGSVRWDALGKGSELTIPFVIDNTAPDIVSVYRNTTEEPGGDDYELPINSGAAQPNEDDTPIIDDPEPTDEPIEGEEAATDTLEIITHDNQFIAAVAVFTDEGELLDAKGAVEDTIRGKEVYYSFDLKEIFGDEEVYPYLLVQVYDYAMNLSTYKINFTDELEDAEVESVTVNPEEALIIGTGSIRLSADVRPWGIDDAVEWTSSDESIVTVDEDGVATGVAEGTATITATSLLNPEISGTCEVTVKFVDKDLNGIVWDENGAVWFSAFNLKTLPEYEKLNGSNLRLAMASLTYDGSGALYGATFDSNAHTSTLYSVNPNDWSVTPVGAESPIGFMDICAAPNSGENILLGVYGTYVLLIDKTTGQYLGAFVSGASANLVGIAYEGSYDYTAYGYGYADYFFLLDEKGNIYEGAMLDQNVVSGWFRPSRMGNLGYTCDTPYFQSLYYDGANLFWSCFNEGANKVDIIMVDDLWGDGYIYNVGSFADGVWPVGGLLELGVDTGEFTAGITQPISVDRFSSEDFLAVIPGAEPDAELDEVIEEPIDEEEPIEEPAPAEEPIEEPVGGGLDFARVELPGDADQEKVEEQAVVIIKPDELMYNGKIVIDFDPSTVHLTSIAITPQYTAVVDRTEDLGHLVLAWVDLEGISPEDPILTLTFTQDSVGTVTITTYEENERDSDNDENLPREELVFLGASSIPEDHDHEFELAHWIWADDFSSAVAVFSCPQDGASKSYEAEITAFAVNASCTEPGYIRYTATVVVDGETYTDEKVVEIPIADHQYGEPEWNWSDDHMSATATFTCSMCHEEQVLEAEVKVSATSSTCMEQGVATYIATVEFQGETYTDEYEELLPLDEHQYGEPEWNWIDLMNCTATFTCSVCGDKQVLEAEITGAVGFPSCTETTYNKFIATVEFQGETYTDEKDVEVPPTGHTYAPPTWEWDGYTAKATFVCIDCSDEQILDAEITSELNDDGTITFTATVELDGETYTDTKTAPVGAQVYGSSMVMGENFSVKGYLFLSADVLADSGAYVTVNGTKIPVKSGNKVKVSGKYAYGYSFDIGPKMFNDQVTIKLYNGADEELVILDKEGEYLPDGFIFTAQEYIDKVIANSTDEKLVNTMIALNDFGHYAQVYFKYNTANIAPLKGDISAVTAEDLAEYAGVITTIDEDVLTYVGSSMMLENEMKIRQYFTLGDGVELSSLTFKINGTKVKPVQKDGMIYIESKNVPAKNLDKPYTFVITDSTGKVVYSSEYSAFSYILNCMQKSTDAKLLNMVKSMVIYNQTAKLYFGN
ncbi:MAG: S8 family serine peptidase [Oscillospiraceae bacterium]|nr:S8 family serine peptidase [Oscillospiraceae bacterium]